MSFSKWAMKKAMERQDALRAVRGVLSDLKAGNHDIWHAGGASMHVLKKGDNVVKVAGPQVRRNEMKRRGFLESILADNDLAPKTFLVETKKNKYMVQPKADFISSDTLEAAGPKKQVKDWYDSYDAGDNLLKNPSMREQNELVEDILSGNANELGLSSSDIAPHNIGWFGGIPKIIDAGNESLNRAMTPAERKSALEKFISYGKRKRYD